jgi:hypothetical protein
VGPLNGFHYLIVALMEIGSLSFPKLQTMVLETKVLIENIY